MKISNLEFFHFFPFGVYKFFFAHSKSFACLSSPMYQPLLNFCFPLAPRSRKICKIAISFKCIYEQVQKINLFYRFFFQFTCKMEFNFAIFYVMVFLISL
jgi:hypothetical protein